MNAWYLAGGIVVCFVLIGFSFRGIQPYLNQLNVLLTLPFFYVFVGSSASAAVIPFFALKKTGSSKDKIKTEKTNACSDGQHCGEAENLDSGSNSGSDLHSSVSNSEDVDSTGASGREQNSINEQSKSFSDEANNDAVRELVTNDVSYDFKKTFPPYFVLPPETKLMKEDGTPIDLDKPTLCWVPAPKVPVEPAPSKEVAVKQKERERVFFKPCKNQD